MSETPLAPDLPQANMKPTRQRKQRRLQSGQSLVEFAVTATILLLLLSGIVDLGRAFMTRVWLEDMVGEGIQHATSYGACIPFATNVLPSPQVDPLCATANTVLGRMENDNPGIDFNRLHLDVIAPLTAQPGDQVVITLSYDMPTITPIMQALYGRTLLLSAQATELVRGAGKPDYPTHQIMVQPPNISPVPKIPWVTKVCHGGNAKFTFGAVPHVLGYHIYGPYGPPATQLD